MRASIIIASHNEGDSLAKTAESCVETCANLDCEIIIADDASTDDSPEEVLHRFPQIHLYRHEQRQGASPTKALGAHNAHGNVLVFLDGHTKPERGAIARLVQDVEDLNGAAIITPIITALDIRRWKNEFAQVGHGYTLNLQTFECGWQTLNEMKPVNKVHGQLYESPALIGCGLALSRELYDKLWGFDAHMHFWGAEDLDLGLKCWLMGYSILHDPQAIIGHHFRTAFHNYTVPLEHVIANQLRMAYKNFTYGVWADWLERSRLRHQERLNEHPEGLWACAWHLFECQRADVERERLYLHSHRMRDEFWYAGRFALTWPRLQMNAHAETGGMPTASFALANLAPGAQPSPPPPQVEILVDQTTLTLGKTNKLQAKVTPPTSTASNYKFEMKRKSESTWTLLANTSNNVFMLQTKVAGFFNVRVTATIQGSQVVSVPKDFEVQFPSFADVVADGDVQSFTDASWQSTLAATTMTSRREEGFWIQFDSTSRKFTHTAKILGPIVGPTQTGSVDLGSRPADNPVTPNLLVGGVFSVASFHTHTPTTFRPVGRPIGPSGADNAADTHDDVTGVVYDYIENPAGSGTIPAGYPLKSPAQRYHSGPTRRSTPT